MKKLNKGYLAAGLLTGLLSLSTFSDTQASAVDRKACADDIAKFCKDVKPGGGAVTRCLEEHENELSPACRKAEAALEGHRAEMKEEVNERRLFRQACNTDIAKFCSDVKPGPGTILTCLSEHEKDLSPACRAQIKTTKQNQE